MSQKPTVLVTGAAGFVGSAFVRSCNAQGIRVISVDKAEYFRTRTEHQGIQFGNIVDRATLFDWLNQQQPKLRAVVHLGACTDTTQLDEEYLRRMNLEYSQKLWTYASKQQIPFVYASSAATYGDGALGYSDDEGLIPSLRPLNPYGESKRLFDIWALDQEKQGLQPPSWSGFKFFNVYGFGERHKGKMASVVLHAFDQIRKTGQVRLFKSHRDGIGDGHQKRDFVYVDDVVSVLHFAIGGSQRGPIPRGIYNLGTGQARTFVDLVRAVFASLQQPERIEFIDTPVELRERYQYFTEARMFRLKRQGYEKPFTSLEKGVASYVERLKAAASSS